MIASIEVVMIVLGLFVPTYWLLPDRWAAARQLILIVVSTVLIFALSPLILLWLSAYILAVVAFFAAGRLGVPKDTLKVLSWGLFVPLIFAEGVQGHVVASALGWSDLAFNQAIGAFAFIGLSYCAIRSFLIVRESLQSDSTPILPSFTSLTFFGSFIAGPIVGLKPFLTAAVEHQLTLKNALRGLSRVGWGAALFLVVKPWLASVPLSELTGVGKQAGALLAWLSMFRAFLVLYVDFAGYSHLAIGIGNLFGISLPENFRKPLTARSIQEFWQHWHMSLGAFINVYLFRPLVRTSNRPILAIIVAFVFVGLWHRFNVLYLVWGLGHGAALAFNMIVGRRAQQLELPNWGWMIWNVAGWAATMTWVAYLSAFANSRSLSEAVRMSLKLLGI